MRTTELTVDTHGRRVVDVTAPVEAFAAEGGHSGLVHVFVPHATAGVALMETGSGSEGDLEDLLERLLPRDDRYRHRHGSVGHGGDHLLPVLVSPSLSIPVDDGRLLLGTWQRLVVVDPNRENDHRRLRLSFLPGDHMRPDEGAPGQRTPGEIGAASLLLALQAIPLAGGGFGFWVIGGMAPNTAYWLAGMALMAASIVPVIAGWKVAMLRSNAPSFGVPVAIVAAITSTWMAFVYTVGPKTWLWLVPDLAACGFVVRVLVRRRPYFTR